MEFSWGGLKSWFLQLHLTTQFMAAMSVIVVLLMSLLTFWTTARVEKAVLEGAGGVGALYLQTFVSPLIDEAEVQSGTISLPLASRLNGLLGTGPLGQHVRTIKIWRPDGSLFYSTDAPDIGEPKVFEELNAALAGEIVVSRAEDDKHRYSDREQEDQLIEVYAPLLRDSAGKVILVGEFYQEPDYLVGELRSVRRGTVLIIVGITVPLLVMLYLIILMASKLIDRQRRSIETNLRNAMDLWAQNSNLRKAADFARLEAGKLNEKVLDQIGNDLHDGPVQVLTLINLRLSDMLAQRHGRSDQENADLEKLLGFVSTVLSDLRKISSGLALPELDDMSLEETIHFAVARYSDLTANTVEMDGNVKEKIYMPHLNVCVYRFIQEGLMNSFRHATGNLQKVRYRVSKGKLTILVADIGGYVTLPDAREAARIKLGKISQKRRISSFGGRMRSIKRKRGTVVVAIMPVNQLCAE
ncbi:ATP-binding protein [Agrobacterium larrymoorei]|uniref:sensor histidine kinase n=1 Tax=Agrobacterium larrymoorei TaxID=160699 RepID=UPI001572FADC|nr:histidine kinase [Agrobacterium larrymoorei]NTJ43915.1 ATP-binding protein [Agrobacterium larrymoorei]